MKPDDDFEPLFLHPAEAKAFGLREGDMWGSYIVRITRPIPPVRPLNTLQILLECWRESRHPVRP